MYKCVAINLLYFASYYIELCKLAMIFVCVWLTSWEDFRMKSFTYYVYVWSEGFDLYIQSEILVLESTGSAKRHTFYKCRTYRIKI